MSLIPIPAPSFSAAEPPSPSPVVLKGLLATNSSRINYLITTSSSSVTFPSLPIVRKQQIQRSTSRKPKEIWDTLNRIPAEVWLLIAAYTIAPYDVVVTEDTYRKGVIDVGTNNARDITCMQLISRMFNEDIRVGFQGDFSGRISFRNWCHDIPAFVDTMLTQRLTIIDIHRQAFDHTTQQPYTKLNKAILAKSYPSLKMLAIASPYLCSLDGQECPDGMHNDEILEEAEETKEYLMSAGLTHIDEIRSYKVGVVFYIAIRSPCTVIVAVELPGTLKIAATYERGTSCQRRIWNQ